MKLPHNTHTEGKDEAIYSFYTKRTYLSRGNARFRKENFRNRTNHGTRQVNYQQGAEKKHKPTRDIQLVACGINGNISPETVSAQAEDRTRKRAVCIYLRKAEAVLVAAADCHNLEQSASGRPCRICHDLPCDPQQAV